MTVNITALWDALGWAILHSLWQGALIGFFVWGVRALATDRHAWLRYLAGMGGLVATFVAFLATFMILTFNRAQSWASIDSTNRVDANVAIESPLSISVLPVQMGQSGLTEAVVPWLGMIWAVGFAFLSLQAYRAYANTRFLATRGLDGPGEDWTARFTTLIARSRTHARVRLFVSEHVKGPMTLGALRPIVLVPVGFLTALPPAQIEAILLHELAHIRRHDFLFGLIQTAIRTVLYFNPAVIMISRQIDEDREKACDDIAVAVSGNPRDLVQGLAALRLGNHAPAMVMSADGGPLLGRLNRLMGRPTSRRSSSRLSAAAVSALLLGTAACSTVSVAHPPEQTTTEAADMSIPDTVVRAKADKPVPAYIIKSADSAAKPVTPKIAVMPAAAVPPAYPKMPAVPALPDVPMPVFSDYGSEDAFEAAMEAWGDRMDDWGDEVERRFEGDWEDKMDAWGEEMEVWGETIEAFAESYDDEGLAALDGLDALAALEGLQGLINLGDLEKGVYIVDEHKMGHKADEIRDRIMQNVYRETEQAKHQREQAELRHEKAEHRREQADELREQAQERREQAQHNAEARAHAVSKSHSTQPSDHSHHEIRVTTDRPGETIKINGQPMDVDRFRADMTGALKKDGFIRSLDDTVKVELCSGELKVKGHTVSKAQSKRYVKIFKSAGLDLSETITVKFKPNVTSLTMSSHG